jgi:hypothetical protein
MKTQMFLLMCMLTVQCTAASDYVVYDCVPINETTPGFSVAPGDYNSTAVTVPLGPYKISFLTRLENITFKGFYEKSGRNVYEGKGKDYHMCTYDIGELIVSSRNGKVDFFIHHYVAPLNYPPEGPHILFQKDKCADYYPYSYYYRYSKYYSPDPTTFVYMQFFDMDWNKDILLILETLNVTS